MGTFLVPSGPGKHLYIIMNAACADGMHIMYSVSSIKDGQAYDDTCMFKGGEHEFIVRPSYVYYRNPEQRSATTIVLCVERGLYVPKADLAQEHFDRIRAGIAKSPFTKPWAEKYCRENGII